LEGLEGVKEKRDLARPMRKKKTWASTKQKDTLKKDQKDAVEGS